MKDPRSIAATADTWLTDSRVYNLIWLGRWIERAHSVVRDVSLAAESASDDVDFARRLTATAEGWSLDESSMLAFRELLGSCLTAARDDAGQVGPLELIEALNAVVQDLPSLWPDAPGASETVSLAEVMTHRLEEIASVIESRWFHRLPD